MNLLGPTGSVSDRSSFRDFPFEEVDPLPSQWGRGRDRLLIERIRLSEVLSRKYRRNRDLSLDFQGGLQVTGLQ